MKNSIFTLIATLPMILTITALAGFIILNPGNLDIRNKAAEPVPTPTTVQLQRPSPTPTSLPTESACSGLYEPVCGINGRTYESECEANNQQINIAYNGECRPSSQTNQTLPAPGALSPALVNQ